MTRANDESSMWPIPNRVESCWARNGFQFWGASLSLLIIIFDWVLFALGFGLRVRPAHWWFIVFAVRQYIHIMNSIFQPTCARVCESVCASPTTVTQTQQWHHLGKLYSKRFLWCHKNTLPTLGRTKRRLLLCSNDMTKDSIRSDATCGQLCTGHTLWTCLMPFSMPPGHRVGSFSNWKRNYDRHHCCVADALVLSQSQSLPLPLLLMMSDEAEAADAIGTNAKRSLIMQPVWQSAISVTYNDIQQKRMQRRDNKSKERNNGTERNATQRNRK